MSKHMLFTAADFIEKAEHDFTQAMLGLEKAEWRLRDALDELDRLSA